MGASLSRASFCEPQRRRLAAAVEPSRARSQANPSGDPLSLLYLIARAGGRAADRQVVHAGSFCLLYVLALDLFDDVQDDDLAGKAYGEVGPPLAVNGAITLMFLALDELRRVMELERSDERRLEFLRLFNRASVAAAAGQELDLMGESGATNTEQVLAMQQAKTSSAALVVECGALLAGFSAPQRRAVSAFGKQLAGFIQIRDDLRDVFGREVSPDLTTGKVTYPVACLHEAGEPALAAELARLVEALPESMSEIRSLFYRAGVVARCAEKMEELRAGMHRAIASTGNTSAYLRTLLAVCDGLATSVYAPPPVRASRALFEPRTRFDRLVRREVERFSSRMGPHGFPGPPTFTPWQAPHWMYAPDQETIFYPDVDGLPDEILPFQASLLGQRDLRDTARVLEAQLPAVVAHELFHYWRDVAGRLTHDHWHEEWAANRLAVAYVAEFSPATLAGSVALADRVLRRFGRALEAPALSILDRCQVHVADDPDYGMSPMEVALLTLEMVRRLARAPAALPGALAELLGTRPVRAPRAGSSSRPRDRSASRRPGRRSPCRSAQSPSSPS